MRGKVSAQPVHGQSLSANVSETIRTQQLSVQGAPGRDDERSGGRGSGQGDRGGGEGQAARIHGGAPEERGNQVAMGAVELGHVEAADAWRQRRRG